MCNNIKHSKSSELCLMHGKEYEYIVTINTFRCDEDPTNINFFYEVFHVLERKPKENSEFWGDDDITGEVEAQGQGSYVLGSYSSFNNDISEYFYLTEESTYPEYYLTDNMWGDGKAEFEERLCEEISYLEDDFDDN